ncbi:MAG: hypothetical protein A4E28_00705 [Methanocella sp. PtaU1.Bin125]|nr:MAG: hypothetical protein A4E28_00705 [Methanocella sp. PtaU1.Bin125]
MIDIELAIAAITIALLILLGVLAALSARLAEERQELQRIKKKIDHAEASIERISGSLSAMKSPADPA